MDICCVSDLHGYLPPELPKSDVVILAGDYCASSKINNQFKWLRETFGKWLEAIDVPVFGVAGNHDLIFEETPEKIPALKLPWTYLQDSGAEFNGLKIWGTPWQPTFFNWAFNLSETELAEKWKLIPDDTDILILHGPPHGYGDFSLFGHEHAGSKSLLERIKEIQPKLVVAGHIHNGYGQYMIGETHVVNASIMNDQYIPVNAPILVEINNEL